MRRPLMLAMIGLMAGCAETPPPPDSGLEQAVRRGALRDKAGHVELRRGGVASGDAALLSLRHFRWNEDERPDHVRTLTYRGRKAQVCGNVR